MNETSGAPISLIFNSPLSILRSPIFPRYDRFATWYDRVEHEAPVRSMKFDDRATESSTGGLSPSSTAAAIDKSEKR